MWYKTLLAALLVSVAVCGTNAMLNEMAPPTCDCDVDLMFLVDGSSSVGEEGFERAKQYITHFIECYNCTNVGMIHCKCEANTSFPLCYFANDLPALLDAVEEVKFCHSVTRVGYCIKHMQCTTHWHYGFPTVVVVLTDGRVYDTYENTDEVAGYAQNARDAGLTMYAGAIGRSSLIDMGGLELISGSSSRVVDTDQDAPSWLAAVITVDSCGTCPALVRSIMDKRPYPWEDDAGPNRGRCVFESRHLQQVCKALTTSDCIAELETYHKAFWDSISDLWDYATDHVTSILDDVDSRVEELISRLQVTIAKPFISAPLRATVETAISEVRSTVAAIRDAATNVIPDLTNIVDGILQNIQGLICHLVDKADQIYGAVEEYFYSLVKDVLGPFGASVKGQIDGLVAVVTGLFNTLPYDIETDVKQLLDEVRWTLLFNYIEWVFGGGLDRLICRFLWWLIRPNQIPFIYPVPYEIPGVPPLPPLPTVPSPGIPPPY